MGVFDSIKGKISELSKNEDATDQALQKAGDLANEKTGGQYADKIEMAKEKADERLGDA